MCLRIISMTSLASGVSLFLTACSSGYSERTYLAGPQVQQYAPAYQRNYAPTYEVERPQRISCVHEPVARRPFPTYVVVGRGDNLCRIAKRYETTVQAIVDTNRLPSPILSVGTRLYLPSPQYYSRSPFGQLRRR